MLKKKQELKLVQIMLSPEWYRYETAVGLTTLNIPHKITCA